MRQRNILFLILFFASSVQATTVVYHDLPMLIQKADTIIRGQVQSQRTQASSDGIVPLYTDVDVRILTIYKTSDSLEIGSLITLQNIGGTLPHQTLTIPGTAKFRPGEEAVLFLEHIKEGGWVILGLAQGKFDIFLDPKTGQKLVKQNLHDLKLIPPSQAYPDTFVPPATPVMTLTQLESLIQKY